MKLVDINWSPTTRQLRQFGGISLLALPLLGWFWSGGHLATTAVLAAIGATLCAASWVAPRAVKPVFLGFSLLAIPLGFVIGEIALLLIYFGLFLPMALCFRLMRRDALQRTIDRRARSYWQPKPQPAGPASYYRQF